MLTAPTDGQVIASAWEDVGHAERKAKATCWRCAFDKREVPATMICLRAGSDMPTLCPSHGQLGLIAGWSPVDLDSEAGRKALETKSKSEEQ